MPVTEKYDLDCTPAAWQEELEVMNACQQKYGYVTMSCNKPTAIGSIFHTQCTQDRGLELKTVCIGYGTEEEYIEQQNWAKTQFPCTAHGGIESRPLGYYPRLVAE